MDIIVLIFLARYIGKLAARKGLKPSTWRIYLVVGWIIAEIIGMFVGIMIFGIYNLVSIVLVGIAFALGSFFFLRNMLDKYPDYDPRDEFEDFGEN